MSWDGLGRLAPFIIPLATVVLKWLIAAWMTGDLRLRHQLDRNLDIEVRLAKLAARGVNHEGARDGLAAVTDEMIGRLASSTRKRLRFPRSESPLEPLLLALAAHHGTRVAPAPPPGLAELRATRRARAASTTWLFGGLLAAMAGAYVLIDRWASVGGDWLLGLALLAYIIGLGLALATMRAIRIWSTSRTRPPQEPARPGDSSSEFEQD